MTFDKSNAVWNGGAKAASQHNFITILLLCMDLEGPQIAKQLCPAKFRETAWQNVLVPAAQVCGIENKNTQTVLECSSLRSHRGSDVVAASA